MLVGIDGCENDAQEIRLLLIVSARFAQTGTWDEVAEAVSEAASDPEAATPIPVLNAQECEDVFRKLCGAVSLDNNLSDSDKAIQISDSLRLKRLHQIQANIRALDEMICVLESDEALLDNQDAMLDLAQIEHHLLSAKDLFFSFPKSADSGPDLPLVPARQGSVPTIAAPVEARSLSMATVRTSSPKPSSHPGSMNITPDSNSNIAVASAYPTAITTATKEPVSSVTTEDSRSGFQPESIAVRPFGDTGISGVVTVAVQHELPLSGFQEPPGHTRLHHVTAPRTPPKPNAMTMDYDVASSSAIPSEIQTAPLSRANSNSLVNPLYDAESSTEISSDPPVRDFAAKRPMFDYSEPGTIFSATLTAPGPVPAILRKPGKGRPKKKSIGSSS